MKYRRKKGQNMGALLDLQQHIDKKEKQLNSYSVQDMILDSNYREKIYKYYNDDYQETKEEQEIFESWTKRRNTG
jgi:hypothetical protein